MLLIVNLFDLISGWEIIWQKIKEKEEITNICDDLIKLF